MICCDGTELQYFEQVMRFMMNCEIVVFVGI